MYSRIIEQILHGSGRSDLIEHINHMGPQEWHKTSLKIVNTNPMLGEAFLSMAKPPNTEHTPSGYQRMYISKPNKPRTYVLYQRIHYPMQKSPTYAKRFKRNN
jgi:hypothetical protein